MYYDAKVPSTIHFEEHAFIDTELCETFTSLMVFAWVSGQNCAHFYNTTLRQSLYPQPPLWPTENLSLSCEQVWSAFYLNAILRDWAEHDTVLTLPDVGDNRERLKYGMEIRNLRMIQHGQPEKMHACDVCEKFVEGNGYKGLRKYPFRYSSSNSSHSYAPCIHTGPLRAVVTDGISIGRPSCQEHNCTKPLINNRSRFCHDQVHLNSRCAIVDCLSLADEGFRTCADPDHRRLEDDRKERGKAFFQLVKRLVRSGITQLTDSFSSAFSSSSTRSRSVPDPDQGDDDLNDGDGVDNEGCDPKSTEGNRQPRAQFGRRRTHNEQLVVACCGIIIARATMFGAEAVSGVKVMITTSVQFIHN